MDKTDVLQALSDSLMSIEKAIEETTRSRSLGWWMDYGTSSRDRKNGDEHNV